MAPPFCFVDIGQHRHIFSVYNQIIMYNKEWTHIQLFSFSSATFQRFDTILFFAQQLVEWIQVTRLRNAVKINGSEMIVDFKETTGYACISTCRLLQKKSVYITNTDALCSCIRMPYWIIFWDIYQLFIWRLSEFGQTNCRMFSGFLCCVQCRLWLIVLLPPSCDVIIR